MSENKKVKLEVERKGEIMRLKGGEMNGRENEKIINI